MFSAIFICGGMHMNLQAHLKRRVGGKARITAPKGRDDSAMRLVIEEIKHTETLSDAKELSAGTSRAIVLLVEQDANVREMLRTFLAMEGYLIFEATSVDEALLLFQIHAVIPHIVLADLHLGEKSGYDLYAWARKHHGTLPFLMMSCEPYIDHEAQRDVNFHLVRKPIHFDALAKLLGRFSALFL
jgi:CheY-like chemotaxis protein